MDETPNQKLQARKQKPILGMNGIPANRSIGQMIEAEEKRLRRKPTNGSRIKAKHR